MQTSALDLYFLAKTGGELPNLPVAKVYAKTWTDDQVQVFLTPECATVRELDTWIDVLKCELEKIRSEAHRRFAIEEKRLDARILGRQQSTNSN